MPAPAFGFALDRMRNPFGADDAKLCQKSAPRDGGVARARWPWTSWRPWRKKPAWALSDTAHACRLSPPACALIQSSPKKTPRQIPLPGRTYIPFYLPPNQNFTFTPAYSERPMPGTAMPQGMLLMPMVVPWPV